MVPGLWGAPLKSISAFSPPMYTQDFNLYTGETHAQTDDYDQGMTMAAQLGKPVLVDFSSKDHQKASPAPVKVKELDGQETTLRTYGDKWSYLQRNKFGTNSQPYYVILDNEGMPLNHGYVYDENVPKYKDFLKGGLERYGKEAAK